MQAVSLEEKCRVDKWLWHARFFKSRSLASRLVTERKLRLNGAPVSKASTTVRAGDVLTFPQANDIRVVRVRALGRRRGPAIEAVTLYEDLTPPKTAAVPPVAARDRGAGRPTKAERRAIDRWRGNSDQD